MHHGGEASSPAWGGELPNYRAAGLPSAPPAAMSAPAVMAWGGLSTLGAALTRWVPHRRAWSGCPAGLVHVVWGMVTRGRSAMIRAVLLPRSGCRNCPVAHTRCHPAR